MEIYELNDNFQPKSELGKAMKMLVENGDHCDGNIYWLIKLFEQKQEENNILKEQLDISQSLHKTEFKKVRRYEQICVEIDSILHEAIESLDNGEPINGLEWAIGLIEKAK